MTEFNIQAGNFGDRGPVNISVDGEGNVTDHGSHIGPDGSITNMQEYEDTVRPAAEQSVDSGPETVGQPAAEQSQATNGERTTVFHHPDGSTTTNAISGIVVGKVVQRDNIEGGVHF